MPLPSVTIGQTIALEKIPLHTAHPHPFTLDNVDKPQISPPSSLQHFCSSQKPSPTSPHFCSKHHTYHPSSSYSNPASYLSSNNPQTSKWRPRGSLSLAASLRRIMLPVTARDRSTRRSRGGRRSLADIDIQDLTQEPPSRAEEVSIPTATSLLHRNRWPA